MFSTGSNSRSDQAQRLRGLMELRAENSQAGHPHAVFHRTSATEIGGQSSSPFPPVPYCVAITSGKGGVGKSLLTLNMAVRLQQQNYRVAVFDAAPGLGNIELLCGLNGYWNLSHVLTGSRRLSEIAIAGPGGITLLPGAAALEEITQLSPPARQDLLRELRQFESQFDFLLVDTGAGLDRSVRPWVMAADAAVIVTTPEPTAIAETYAELKRLHGLQQAPAAYVLVNKASNEREADLVHQRLQNTARRFLHIDIASIGFMPLDLSVEHSVVQRRPFVMDDPSGPATHAATTLAGRITGLAMADRPSAQRRSPDDAAVRKQPLYRDSYTRRFWQRIDVDSAAGNPGELRDSNTMDVNLTT